MNSHDKSYKLKYNDYMKNRKAEHLILAFKVTYNWQTELFRVSSFQYWYVYTSINRHIFNFYFVPKIKYIQKEISLLTNLEI